MHALEERWCIYTCLFLSEELALYAQITLAFLDLLGQAHASCAHPSHVPILYVPYFNSQSENKLMP